MANYIEVFDSTLRDGAQAEGISFSIEDKVNIVRALDELGVKFIEAGNPGSNPKDLEFFRRAKEMNLKNSSLVAFGSTCRKGTKACEDANVNALLTADTKYVAIFGKCWDMHVTDIINTTLEENLRMIEDTVSFLKGQSKVVIFDGEHFFDGYKANPEYAVNALEAAVKGGADRLVLCDTNGGSFPSFVYKVTKEMVERFSVPIGIHCHNDGGMAVANSIAAVEAGAVQVQGTFLGFGERCGNANLCTTIANLQLKEGKKCIPEENMGLLTSTANNIAEIANIILQANEPYVGASAFAHKAGMHADGVIKASNSFEHINPEVVGNERRFLVSEIAGRTAIVKKINKLFPELDKNSPEIRDIMERLKVLEFEGYQFEGADSSFELVVRRRLQKYEPFFELVNYKVMIENPYEDGCSATATLKLKVGKETRLVSAQGDGPVHALDLALRQALVEFYPTLEKAQLIDYKVRVLDSREATAAKVRVLITSSDGKMTWSSVGVSTDIIEASWIALVDSIEYKLLSDREKLQQ